MCGREGAGGRFSPCAPGPLPLSRPLPPLSGPAPLRTLAPAVRTQSDVPLAHSRPLPLALSPFVYTIFLKENQEQRDWHALVQLDPDLAPPHTKLHINMPELHFNGGFIYPPDIPVT